jgi:hypothetical protein
MKKMKNAPVAKLAAIYRTSDRQIRRWIDKRAPILVAVRMKSFLLSQNHYGETGSRLQDEAQLDQIQAEIDSLYGDDLRASAHLIDSIVSIDEELRRAQRLVKESHLSQKAAWLKALAKIAQGIKASDNLLLLDAVDCEPPS